MFVLNKLSESESESKIVRNKWNCSALNFFNFVLITFLCGCLDGRQCGNNLALCNFAVVMELPDSLYMNWKSEFGVIFLRCSPR